MLLRKPETYANRNIRVIEYCDASDCTGARIMNYARPVMEKDKVIATGRCTKCGKIFNRAT